jgi:hypothetical protein
MKELDWFITGARQDSWSHKDKSTAKRRDEALEHPDTPTMTKACIQHIVENAKEKLHNRKEKQLKKH